MTKTASTLFAIEKNHGSASSTLKQTHLPTDVGAHMSTDTQETTVISAEKPGLLHPLSARELEILKQLNGNRTAKMIGVALGISPRTVQFHTDNLYWKLAVSGINARERAVKRARELGIID